MSGIGTGYDLSATTYSPDGRVFQVEYAGKAVENSGTAAAIRVKNGVILAVEKIIVSKMLVEGSNKRIFRADRHVGVAAAGLVADARQLVNRARTESTNYLNFYGSRIPPKLLCDRLSGFVQMHTLYGYIRPFGCSILLGSYHNSSPELYMVEPSGISYGYYGCAIGKAKANARTEIEKLKLSQMTMREGVIELARIIYTVHDDVKDKEFELEISWVGEETDGEHQFVPKDLKDKAIELALDSLKEREMQTS